MLRVDEKSQIQALDRTQPLPPLRPGRIERRTHDDQRHGTTTLFAAFDVKAGTIVDECMPRHRAQEFPKFLDEIERNVPTDLDMHVVMDNASNHKTKLIRGWFAKLSRWHVHFTPTSSSWVNQVPTLKNIATPARRSSQSSAACPQETCFGPTPEPMRSTKADRCTGDRTASDADQECAGSSAPVPGEHRYAP
ncbi:MAG: IS630 family transposase [Methylocella sp.]